MQTSSPWRAPGLMAAGLVLLALSALVGLAHPRDLYGGAMECTGWVCGTVFSRLPGWLGLAALPAALLWVAGLWMWVRRLPEHRDGGAVRDPGWGSFLLVGLVGSLLPGALAMAAIGGIVAPGLGMAAVLGYWAALSGLAVMLTWGTDRPRRQALRMWFLLPLGLVLAALAWWLVVWVTVRTPLRGDGTNVLSVVACGVVMMLVAWLLTRWERLRGRI